MLKHTDQISFNYMGNIWLDYIMIYDQGYDDNHLNGIIDLTDEGIDVRQSFL